MPPSNSSHGVVHAHRVISDDSHCASIRAFSVVQLVSMAVKAGLRGCTYYWQHLTVVTVLLIYIPYPATFQSLSYLENLRTLSSVLTALEMLQLWRFQPSTFMSSEPYYVYIEIIQYVYAAIQSNQQYSSRKGVHAVFIFCTCTCSRQQHLKSVHTGWSKILQMNRFICINRLHMVQRV